MITTIEKMCTGKINWEIELGIGKRALEHRKWNERKWRFLLVVIVAHILLLLWWKTQWDEWNKNWIKRRKPKLNLS